MSMDEGNRLFSLTFQYVNHTDRNIFLTGRAGTGKTTFLRHLRESTFKKVAVVAPTGVAAINAGGATIHSLFQIPPGVFLSDLPGVMEGTAQRILTPDSLMRKTRYSDAKKDLIRELELLVIDEVSMVRSDMMDAIDHLLRFLRKRSEPFGGVQLLLIGDLFQLPPVVVTEEWELMKDHYEGPFFFDAKVMRKNPPLCIELTKIYRQSDDHFIRLLNAVRNNVAGPAELQELNDYHRPGFMPPPEEEYITITTHNARAEHINRLSLASLAGEEYCFDARIEGDFPEKSYPADLRLNLKVGAQVMFIRNDKGEERRYYNGKIGRISHIDKDRKIFIGFTDGSASVELEAETWRNLRYSFSREKDRIEEEELGNFTQYPIRLAWAITIHKSQGLTFEKAVIDAGDSFSAGQVYVALSRMRDLSGMVLRSRIHPHSIRNDERVVEFCNRKFEESELEEALKEGQWRFVRKSLLEAFDMEVIARTVMELKRLYESEASNGNDGLDANWVTDLLRAIRGKMDVVEKFRFQLEMMLDGTGDMGKDRIHERNGAAVEYFIKVIDAWLESVKGESVRVMTEVKINRIQKKLKGLEACLSRKRTQLQRSLRLSIAMSEDAPMESLLSIAEAQHDPIPSMVSADVPKRAKAQTAKPEPSAGISLNMYRQGVSVRQVAETRQLSISTVFGHLSDFIRSGDVDIHDLMEGKRIGEMLSVLGDREFSGLGEARDLLGRGYEYHEIRAVLAHRDWVKNPKAMIREVRPESEDADYS